MLKREVFFAHKSVRGTLSQGLVDSTFYHGAWEIRSSAQDPDNAELFRYDYSFSDRQCLSNWVIMLLTYSALECSLF